MTSATAQWGQSMNEELHTIIGGLLQFSGHGRVPLHLQTETSECGLACLAMVAGFHGSHTDLLTLREWSGLSARGSTLASLISVAGEMHLAARALSLDLDSLRELRKPCILHWDLNHFVVLVSVKGKRCVVHDPASGRQSMSLEALSSHFTGVALELWPDTDFKPDIRQKKLKTSTLLNNITGFRQSLVKIFCLSLMIEFITLLMPVATQMVMDNAVPAADTGLLTLICLSLLLLTLLQTGLSLFRGWMVIVMGIYTDLQWKDGLYRHLLRLPLCWFEKRRIGDIQSRFASLDTLRSTFTQSINGAVIDGVMATGAFVLLILYGGWLAWVVTGFTLIFVLLRVFTWPRYRQAQEELLIKNARVASSFTETLYAAATVRAQGLSLRRREIWLNMMADATGSGVSLLRFDMLAGSAGTFIAASDSVIILWLGISAVINHTMTLGAFVAFTAFRGMFSERVLSLTGVVLQLRMLSLHNERIADIALSDPEGDKEEVKRLFPAGEALTLKCEDLMFRYDRFSPPVLQNLNICIGAGESVAITGASGRGKTTLMKILCGLTTPVKGRVLVNDVDIQAAGLSNYRRAVACILQDDRLLAGTLRDNITGFSHDVDEEWMVHCARLSQIHDDIMALPMGYETLTGELGEGLSGGQRQRLFIARALYRRPGIIFMDEATSHLDEKNEALINAAMQTLKMTRVLIAHRPSTISSADRIIEL